MDACMPWGPPLLFPPTRSPNLSLRALETVDASARGEQDWAAAPCASAVEFVVRASPAGRALALARRFLEGHLGGSRSCSPVGPRGRNDQRPHGAICIEQYH